MTSWRAVPDYPGYQVSDDGQVRSLHRFVRNRWGAHRRRGAALRASTSSEGYQRVKLYRDGHGRTLGIHVLMASAFLEGSGIVRHLNDNPGDNRLENLAYGTHADNAQDKVRNGNHNMARKTHCDSGHEFTAENTYVVQRGDSTARHCKECQRRRVRAYRASGRSEPA